MLAFSSFDEFKKDVTSAFPTRPKSFTHIISTNKKGAHLLDTCPMDKGLSPKQFEEMMADGAVVIDARDSAAYGGFHIPGSINIGFEKQLANWVGMVIEPGSDLLLVVNDRDDYERMVTELHRIGYDQIFGYLSGGIMAWLMSGRPVNQMEQVSPQQLDALRNQGGLSVIDVRTPAEWQQAHLEHVTHVPLSDLLEGKLPDADKEEPLVVICGSGYRSNIAGSVLQRAGFKKVKSMAGGLFAYANAGLPVG